MCFFYKKKKIPSPAVKSCCNVYSFNYLLPTYIDFFSNLIKWSRVDIILVTVRPYTSIRKKAKKEKPKENKCGTWFLKRIFMLSKKVIEELIHQPIPSIFVDVLLPVVDVAFHQQHLHREINCVHARKYSTKCFHFFAYNLRRYI